MTTTFTPTPHQLEALAALNNAIERGDEHIHLHGYAGTGKTTLAILLVQQGAELLAPTGKAAARLRDKTGQMVNTIHSRVCGRPVEEQVVAKRDELVFDVNLKLPRMDGLVIVDEASMVNAKLGRMLCQKLGRKAQVLWIQDPFQLPPVEGKPFASDPPTALLTEVIRQGAGSPVLDYATAIRDGKRITFDRWVEGPLHEPFCRQIRATETAAAKGLLKARAEGVTSTVLTHTNRTRISVNAICRELQGFTNKPPQPGEPLVSLTNLGDDIRNGEVFTVVTCTPHTDVPGVYMVTLEGQDEPMFVVPRHMGKLHQQRDVSMMQDWYAFWQGTPFRNPPGQALVADYGYALTTTKSQGSEWEVIIHIAERWATDTPERLHYTAVTRASRGYLQVRL